MKKDNFTGLLAGTQRNTRKEPESRTPAEKSGKSYKFNLRLSEDFREYLSTKAWENKTSVTQLINDILSEYKEKHPCRDVFGENNDK